MNILYLHTHDMGRHNEIYGYKIRTPNFLSVANDAYVFRNAHCAGPTCSPSRAALLTGMFPHSAGINGLAHRGFEISNPKQHLSWYLKEQGYTTALFGVQHEVTDTSKLGYETTCCPAWDYAQDKTVVEQASKFISDYNSSKPFFLSVGLFAPHRPFIESSSESAFFVQPPLPLSDCSAVRKDYADYISSVEYADQCAGLVLKALRESNKYDDTLILLTTDHGIAFPYMKCNLYDSGTGVTMCIKLPKQRGAVISDQLISQIDVFPSICDLLQSKKPSWLQGKSLIELLHGKNTAINEEIFSEVTYHAAYEPMRCIRTNRYKLIIRFDNYGKHVLPNIDAGLSKTQYIKDGFADRTLSSTELFDLLYDPYERDNLSDNPKLFSIQNELKGKLREWQENTSDPILKGAAQMPLGAKVNPQNMIDPDEVRFMPN